MIKSFLVMETLKYIWENNVLRNIAISILSIILIIIIVLFIIHLVKTSRGQYSKFLWFESTVAQVPNQTKDSQIIKGKNINTGSNFGKIGDN